MPDTPDDDHPLSYVSSKADVEASARTVESPQTRSPTYRLAFDDRDLMLRDEMRALRLQLEFAKADLTLRERGIKSTVVIFGSARIPEPGKKSAIGGAPGRALERKSKFYKEARRFATLVSRVSAQHGGCEFVVVSGGGPGIMEAANRGASDVGMHSIGLNIVLPHEQDPNPYVTPDLCFQFHYFGMRKMHFLLRAKALVCFPGGLGTLDELFETLTLTQTGKIEPMPILLFGRSFWERIVNFQALVDEGTISAEDLDLITYVDTAEEAWAIIAGHYAEEDLNGGLAAKP
ncbi:TIGR00730 family Rossman fold protein [Breoghania sp. L-A4]|uniref:LOG family protein n=1 Tax=Breoghania sp. L-A4 TaxID=2304600 RepID=UPI000E359A82|nr:TIGR00730 family Rossman fold protein [Breoghania sp. L-A4]AXS39221.1 TIGR00730 family Rossman fold protein [Breoghania sp. L-A4]